MPASTEDVVNNHLERFGAGDLSGILGDYSDQSIMILPDGSVLRGVEQIKPLFVKLLAEFAKPVSTFKLGQKVIEGEIAYITWSAETADNVYEFVTDTFIIRDAKILVQTFGYKATAKG